ncbi:MAG: hypothetical protein J5537_12745 [Lachnospiraceae bacterium]|nr:hypothetical protein [Lachnospiraceae bacterium]
MLKLILYSLLLLVMIGIMIASHIKFPKNKDLHKDLFYMSALLIYSWIDKRKHEMNIIQTGRGMSETLRALNPGGKVETLKKEYAIGKIKMVFIILLSGNVLAIAVCLSGMGKGNLMEGGIIERNDYGKGAKVAEVRVEAQGLPFHEDFSVSVPEREYSVEQLESMTGDFLESLEKKVIGPNENSDQIKRNINLVRSLDGYPFTISWDSRNYNLIDSEGRVRNETVSDDGEIVVLTCEYKYEDYVGNYEFAVRVLPPDYSEEEIWRNAVEEELQKSQEATSMDSDLLLPAVADDTDLIWTERDTDESAILLILSFVIGFIVFHLKDKDLEKNYKERNKELVSDYCKVVNRLALYMSAGMTTRAAFNKIAEDYKRNMYKQKKKRFVYEEMLLACNEMLNGESEVKSYENFGLRCSVGEYARLVGLLGQSLKKGNAGILSDLKAEAYRAQTERQNTIRKKGEEAGTKLLLPMTIMLGIVMVLIMMPAFMSFAG